MKNYDEHFRIATGVAPFPFQCDFGGEGRDDCKNDLPALVDVPTGLGKTAMAVLGWLWRRRFASDTVRRATPRRLVYCLPMRVLVEQTRDNAVRWLHNINQLAGTVVFDPPLADGERATVRHRVDSYAPPSLGEFRGGHDGRVAVYVLMGGEGEPEWDVHPERDAIIIGTQDMLLSRALNRGYAASRARWPLHFGLLNTDCLWVFDEIQLMGSGLATTAQLEAFRRQLTGEHGPKDNGCKSVWMSATLRPDWLRTVDFAGRIDDRGRIDGKTTLSLSDEDYKNKQVDARWNAKKPLLKAESETDDPAALASEVRSAHKPGTRTIVVVNTVKRACALFDALSKASSAAKAKLVLLHSRFRPPDRAKRVAEALANVDPNDPGTIIVSTQVIEAGVDVSAATLFTELAPWASLVQRFGRCNRRGECDNNNGSTHASVHWIDVADKDAAPYDADDLKDARDQLDAIDKKPKAERNVGPRWLPSVPLKYKHTHVIRRKDLLDLFDTTPDLAGNDIDIDRYVREVEETDVRVFWRDYGDPKGGATPNDINGEGQTDGDRRVETASLRDELSPVAIGDFKTYTKKHRGRIWRWNFTEKVWEHADQDSIAPGQVFLVHVAAGGYSSARGWSGDSDDIPSLDHAPTQTTSDEADGYDDDHESQTGVWQTIAEHTRDVCSELDRLLTPLEMPSDTAGALRLAGRWHDWGKVHDVFQAAVKDDGRPSDRAELRTIAKAPKHSWQRYTRKHFRHELASALAVLQRPHDSLKSLSDDDLNLIAYLIAAHHGKVRVSIRSMPNEIKPRTDEGVPQPQKRFARGVWDGDMLPSVDLGGGMTAVAVTLSLEPMELGLCETEPFTDQPSWIERVLRLRDRLGPFRLAYLEAILRAADQRASATGSQLVEVNNA